ncbi:MAG: peptidylprolyl isomerase [bacterium]|nr:peptidylprolyl isomerase [bacterium]
MKKWNNRGAALWAALFLAASAVSTGQEILDGVVAVVGDEIVQKSELEQMAQYYALQTGLRPADHPAEYQALKHDILQNLIDDRVMMAKAKEDTVTVDDAKVEAELENRIRSLVQQMGSEAKVEAQFGAPIKKIKRDHREEVKNMMIVRELQNTKFRGLQVSRREVESFYESIRDSLPEKKPTVRLSQILLRIQPGEASRVKSLERVRQIRDRIRKGESFEALAREASEDPGTAGRGGDLGFVDRGTLFPAFEEAAFQLNPGQVSDVVETPVGFHLIQAVEKRGDQIHCRHILIRIEKSGKDDEIVLQRIAAVRERAMKGEDFNALARECSDDSSTRAQGGDLGWFSLDDVQIDEFRNAADTLEVGEISMPFETQFGFHIVKMEGRREKQKYSLTDDYEQFRARALEFKMQKMKKQWIDQLKKTMYIKVNEDLI